MTKTTAALSLEDVEELASKVSHLNLPAFSEDSVAAVIAEFAQGYVTYNALMRPQTVFRARWNEGHELFDHPAKLGAPDPTKVKRRGRFNGINESVFYCASSPEISVFETRPTPNRWITITAFRMFDPSVQISLSQIGLQHYNDDITHGTNFKNLVGGLQNHPQFLSELKAQGIEQQWLVQDRLFSELATTLYEPAEEQDRYKLTLAIARGLMGREGSGLLYPTVQGNHRGFNIALKKDVATELFYPLESWVLNIGDRVDPPTAPPSVRLFDGPVIYRGLFAEDKISWSAGHWRLKDLQLNLPS